MILSRNFHKTHFTSSDVPPSNILWRWMVAILLFLWILSNSFSSTINWTNSYWLYINTKDSFPYQIYYSDLAQLIHLLASIYACYTRVFILCCLSINYWNQQQHTYAILLTMHCSFLKLFNNYDTKNTMVMLDLGFGCNCVEKSKGFYFCMVCCRICTVCMLILAFLDM